MARAHESETIVFNFRKLLSTLPNYTELEQILLFSVNWGKQVCILFSAACLTEKQDTSFIIIALI